GCRHNISRLRNMQAKYFRLEKDLIIRPLKSQKRPFARTQLHVIHEVRNRFIRRAFPAENAWKMASCLVFTRWELLLMRQVNMENHFGHPRSRVQPQGLRRAGTQFYLTQQIPTLGSRLRGSGVFLIIHILLPDQ
ncbi:MAG: hypothetical protein ACKOEV_11500, partial [Cytophagales bacterium]